MRTTLLLVLLTLGASPTLAQQLSSRLEGRWVGTYTSQSLHLDFYGDTMLVVNDRYPLDYRVTYDSLIVWGDTAFAVRYWFSLDRLLLETANGRVLTMARQSPLARPIEGLWRGSPIGQSRRTVTLRMWRGGTAQRRVSSGGGWVEGEWSRRSRTIEFTWMPDSTVWTASYDPLGEALLFEQTENLGTLVLRKVWR